MGAAAVTVLAVLVAVVFLATDLGGGGGGGSGSGSTVTTTLPAETDGEGQLKLLLSSEVRPSGERRVVARSYDGNEWESVSDADFDPVDISCDGSVCTVTASGGDGTYEVVNVDVPAGLQGSPVARAARLMSQAGFGAPKEELEFIASTYGDNVGAWVLDQMRAGRTSARAHFRRRANPRVDAELATMPQPQTSACDAAATRWHTYVFTARDEGLALAVATSGGRFQLTVDGVLRAEVEALNGETNATLLPFLDGSGAASLTVCQVFEGLGQRVRVATDCGDSGTRADLENPQIDFADASATLGAALQDLAPGEASFVAVQTIGGGVHVLGSRTVACTLVPTAAGHAYVRLPESGDVARFDRRARFWTNTLEEPSLGGPGEGANGTCPLVDPNVRNRDTCVRRPSCGDTAPTFSTAEFTLDAAVVRAWYTDTPERPRYVYVVRGLRLEAPFAVSPCASRASRWQRVSDAPCAGGQTGIDATTRATLAAAIAGSLDENPFVRDVRVTGEDCDATDEATIGARVEADGACFQHVHPDEFSVRDATLWTSVHDGNVAAMAGGGANPIKAFAVAGLHELSFPASHPMTRWADRRRYLTVLGRFGDSVSFSSLDSTLQTAEMARRVGAFRDLDAVAGGTVACGSRDEVANVPALGNHYHTHEYQNEPSDSSLDFPVGRRFQERPVLNNVMFGAGDQLRQRVTWALSTVVVISQADLNLNTRPEALLVYWDALSAHAFGNYLDVLREVSWSPLMSRYLTYDGSRSYASSNSFPDENYARELVQLFSLGLLQLGSDGEPLHAEDGTLLQTYDTDDIEDMARIWTGFVTRSARLNSNDEPNRAYTDPSGIRADFHDRLPKADLGDGFVGDGYPLCDELPGPDFLMPGARFEFTGSGSVEGDEIDSAGPEDEAGRRGRFAPEPGVSALHARLCAAPAAGEPCTFPIVVELDEALECSGEQECGAGRVYTVQVRDPVANVTQYYSYFQPPCVRLTFFPEGKTAQFAPWSQQCADPATTRAGPACCAPDDLDRLSADELSGSECLFTNEGMTFDTAAARCEAQNLTVCDIFRQTASWDNSCASRQYLWTNVSCQVRVQVYPNSRIAVVDTVDRGANQLGNNTFNYFRPRWSGGRVPLPAGGVCPTDACTVQPTVEGDSCLCDITVDTAPAYASADEMAGLRARALASALRIGAAAPEHFGGGATYSRCVSSACRALADGVTVWLHAEDGGQLTGRTIVELPPLHAGLGRRLRMNRRSTVRVGDEFSFQNPPNFMPYLGWVRDSNRDWDNDHLWARQVEHEVDAFLQHVVQQPSTAPFVVKRLIQNMVTSNPSQRYVRAAVRAFRTGAAGSVEFSGVYGDLAATVYAILTDREARSSTLLADASSGMAFDPLVKVMSLLRSLGYQSAAGREIHLDSMMSDIGQQVLSAETVFGFHDPFFKPEGAAARRGLVAPQTQLFSAPLLVGLLNGAYSLIDNGLTNCRDGFGRGNDGGRVARTCNNLASRQATSDGRLTFEPRDNSSAAAVVRELADILTGGRVLEGEPTWRKTVEEYERVFAEEGNQTEPAVRHATKVLVSAPEFHTSGVHKARASGQNHTLDAGAGAGRGRPFKAVVVVNLRGGADSFNMLVPHSECGETDLFSQYTAVRGNAALGQSRLIPIPDTTGAQPCGMFGMHDSMGRLAQLYSDGDLLWFANTGALTEPTTVEDFKNKDKGLPPSLFSHNIMQRSMQTVHAQVSSADGVLGRATDALVGRGFSASMAKMSSSTGDFLRSGTTPADVISGGSARTLQQQDELRGALEGVNLPRSENVMSDTYGREVLGAVTSAERVQAMLDATELASESFGDELSRFERQLETAAVVIRNVSLSGVERVTLAADKGGFDTHNLLDLDELFGDVDSAIGKFADELKAQGVWDSTVVVIVSEFGRTLASNGAGTDHAWAGNYMCAGGALRGGRILGRYPSSLEQDSDVSLGSARGRLLPTTSWEAMWHGVLEWYGIRDADMDEVLPNAANFGSQGLFSEADLFE